MSQQFPQRDPKVSATMSSSRAVFSDVWVFLISKTLSLFGCSAKEKRGGHLNEFRGSRKMSQQLPRRDPTVIQKCLRRCPLRAPCLFYPGGSLGTCPNNYLRVTFSRAVFSAFWYKTTTKTKQTINAPTCVNITNTTALGMSWTSRSCSGSDSGRIGLSQIRDFYLH
jgi:hypothetical protein